MGVLVERCRYLEEVGCASICINSCKVPTQVRAYSYVCVARCVYYVCVGGAAQPQRLQET